MSSSLNDEFEDPYYDISNEEANEVFETEKTSVELISESILEATGESKDPGSNLSRSKTLECL